MKKIEKSLAEGKYIEFCKNKINIAIRKRKKLREA